MFLRVENDKCYIIQYASSHNEISMGKIVLHSSRSKNRIQPHFYARFSVIPFSSNKRIILRHGSENLFVLAFLGFKSAYSVFLLHQNVLHFSYDFQSDCRSEYGET